MKKLVKLFIVIVVLCTTACTQIFDNRNDIEQMKNVGRLVMKVANNSRTINPTIEESDIKSAVLTANGNEIKSWSGDNIISQIENTDDILLDVGNYDFTMTFRNANGTDILTATTNQEIVPGDNTLHFDMKLVTTGVGTGDISITLTWDVASGIKKITAGLYDISTDEPLADFEDTNLEITNIDGKTPTATYSPSGVPVGQYIIKFKVYNQDEKLLNTSTDVIKVAPETTTSTQITLSKINTQYTITYNLSGGNWADGFTPIEDRNANAKIVLPTAENITKGDYEFGGWYDDNNNRITEIPSDTAQNISVTAKWYNDICTVSEAKNVILELSGEGPYDIAVTGEITNVNLDIQAIKDGLNGNQGAKVNLDLSQTTEWDELPVWSFEGCINLTSIILPDSVTSIGDTAFQYCSNLTSINIPNGVTSIETKTFNGCSSLTEIDIPDSVTSIGDNAFTDCNAVKTLVTGNGLESLDNLPITSALESITIGDSITEIGVKKFKGFTNLTSVTIGSGVTTIDSSAFSGCTSLQTVTIGSGVTSIDNSAFNSCSALTSVTFAEDSQLTAIDGSAFYSTGLTDISIPASVTTIGYDAFSDCSALTSVTFAEDSQLTAIDRSAFYFTGLTDISIPASVTSIGDDAFYGCSALTSVTFAEDSQLTAIGERAFHSTGLTEITIPDSVTIIDSYAFYCCSSLTEIDIPDSVKTIESYTFYDCNAVKTLVTGNGLKSLDNLPITSALEFITIGDSITDIGDAFSGCTSLTFSVGPTNTMYSTSDDGNILFNNDQTEIISYPSATREITIPDSVITIGADAFSGCLELTSVTIVRGVTSIGESAFVGCTSLNFIVDSANTMYSTSDDGKILFNNDQTEIISYPSATGEITIPDSVKTISASAFYGCNSVTTLEIGNGLTSLDYLPITSALESITIGDSITEIGAKKFYEFTNLKSVTFADNSQLTKIGEYAFCGCSQLTEITIPDSVTTIGSYVFYGCGLRSVTIPDTVTSIGIAAFYGCSSLTTVNYRGTEEEWGQIIIGDGNDNLTNAATKNYNYQGE